MHINIIIIIIHKSSFYSQLFYIIVDAEIHLCVLTLHFDFYEVFTRKFRLILLRSFTVEIYERVVKVFASK